MAPTVAVCVVTHDSAADLHGCLASIERLEYRPLEIVVVDCASTDDSLDVVRQYPPSELPLEVVALQQNLGFAGGMNRALEHTRAPFVLTLNPDARPEPDFVDKLVTRAQMHSDRQVGAVAGRLRRFRQSGEPAVLDACGMMLKPTWRHIDRGSGEPEGARWTTPERVFGATGAASLWRRQALDDVAIEGQIYAEEFHSYREDAELSFRLRERGWEILYEPEARCVHRRRTLPSNRAAVPAEINCHSLKNRYLLRAYHQNLGNLALTLLPATARDLVGLIYVLLRERSSLAAYRWLWRNRAFVQRRRQAIRQRRTSSSWAIDRWFIRRSLPL